MGKITSSTPLRDPHEPVVPNGMMAAAPIPPVGVATALMEVFNELKDDISEVLFALDGFSDRIAAVEARLGLLLPPPVPAGQASLPQPDQAPIGIGGDKLSENE